MIYISSSSSKQKNILEIISELIENGIENIELSGGSKYYNDLENDLIRFKEQNNVNFLLHNYFPPPKKDFVLNLASLNQEIYNQSIIHIKNAIDLSEKLGANLYAFHAGFYYDIPVNQIGKPLSNHKLNNKSDAVNRFKSAYQEIESYNNGRIKLYLENNVISEENYKRFGLNPLMLTSLEDYNDLKQEFDFNLLLDLAHLYVSCNSLGFDFKSEAIKLSQLTDYIHISDNDGKRDSNQPLKEQSDIVSVLNEIDLNNKTITLEVYDNYSSILDSKNIILKKSNAQ